MKKIALIVLLAAAALPAAQTRNQATTVVDPSLYQQVYYRPLSPVWSRGGRVTAVTGVASNPRLYYMGAAGGGVWRSTDCRRALGAADRRPDRRRHDRRRRRSRRRTRTSSTSAPAQPIPRGNVTNGDGVYKSIDAGKTWTHIGLEKAGLIGRIAFTRPDPNVAYVAVLGNIFGPNPERGVYRDEGRRQDVGAGAQGQRAHRRGGRHMDVKNPD